ncbi:MAG TPA: guanylate kinase [Dehalococcoidia bacterium]|nr:guanylate kinase [Dehalococcoidia bacterium]
MTPEASAEPALVVVISGPSGVGKDLVIDELRRSGYPFRRTVTATTRAPRPDEQPGVHYFFYAVDEFERRIADGFFVEYSRVYDRYYGIPRNQIEEALASGLDVIVKPDVQGAIKLRRLLPAAVLIFLAPESIDQLADRMARRGSETEEEFQRRLAAAQTELDQIAVFDYLVVNREGRLDETVARVRAILQAEKCRVRRLRPPR